MCVPWLIHMCAMTNSGPSKGAVRWVATVWQDTWLIHACSTNHRMWDMTHSYVWYGFRHVSFTCVTWLMHTCAITHSYVCHNSFLRVLWLTQARQRALPCGLRLWWGGIVGGIVYIHTYIYIIYTYTYIHIYIYMYIYISIYVHTHIPLYEYIYIYIYIHIIPPTVGWWYCIYTYIQINIRI